MTPKATQRAEKKLHIERLTSISATPTTARSSESDFTLVLVVYELLLLLLLVT